MTKKDYIAVAAVMNSAMIGNADPERVARKLAEVFALDNPRFDRARFLAACGVPAQKGN